MTDRNEWIEVQATAEGAPCTAEQLARLLAAGRAGIQQLLGLQQAALSAGPKEAKTQ
jgi:ribonuclease PH